MKLQSLFFGLIALISLFLASAFADTIILRDGTVAQGTFVGGSANTVLFNHQGQIKEIPLSAVVTISIGERHTAETHAGQGDLSAVEISRAAEPSAATENAVTIPAGTALMVTTSTTVSTDFHGGSNTFPAALYEDVVINGNVVIPKGTHVYGQVLDSKHAKTFGHSKLVVDLTAIYTEKGTVDITTDNLGYQSEESQTGNALKTTGSAAAIGAAFSKNRAKGAAEGAAVGAALALLSSGQHIKIPAGTILKFTLQQPVTIH